jgi:hypothetical protein
VDNQATNYLSSAFGGAYHCIYDYQYSLSAGANLISFYGADDNDMFIENMMSSLEMASGIVGQGEAAQKLPNGAWVGSLVEIDRSSGYWVLLALPDTTSIVGGAMNHETQYCINEGVNLLSFSGSQATSVADALPDEIEPYIDGIIGQGEAAQQFGGNWLGSLTHFDKWGGYWFKSISEQEICFTYEGGITLPRSAVMYVDTSVPDNLSFTQSTKQSFFFIEEPKNMDENHYVVAVVGQTIIGAAPHQGEITTVPAMGMDFQDDTYDYATDGQNIELLVHDGQEYVGRLVGPHTAKWEDMGMKMMQNMAMMPLTPESYSLYPAYPNPFNPSTEIRFDLPADSKITLEVYDIQGRMVSQLVNGNMQAGYHRVKWNASDKASGVYFVNMRSGSYAQTQKLMLIK